jgi:hypothetical protein
MRESLSRLVRLDPPWKMSSMRINKTVAGYVAGDAVRGMYECVQQGM